MAKMWRTVGREETFQLLCAPFINQSNSDLHTLTSITQIASDIIQNRDSSPTPCATLNITDIPSSLIGEVASYLYQESYSAFSTTSRKLYVDCNSPNRLQEMDLTKVDNYACIEIERYSQIKCLQINLKQIHQFKALKVNGQILGSCNQLQELLINGAPISGDKVTISDLEMLINDTSPCLSALSCLTFTRFAGDTAIPLRRFMTVLNNFPNVAYLTFTVLRLEGTLDPLQLSAVCPNITDLSIIDSSSRLTVPMLISWGSKISTLSIDGSCLRGLAESGLSTLKRIFFGGMPTIQIDTILSANKSLFQIAFIPNVSNPPVPDLTIEAVMDITKRCIVEQKSLEFFYVSTRCHFEAICSGIYYGMFMTKKRERQQMEISLNVDVREITNAAEFVCNISKIVHVLGISNIEQCTVCVDANRAATGLQVFDWEPMKLILEDFVDSIDNVSLLNGSSRTFAIGNVAEWDRHVHWWHQPVQIAYY